MHIISAFFLSSLALFSLGAQASPEYLEPTVLSVASIRIDGNEVALPKTKMPDGSICQSYVAHIERSMTETSNQVHITVDQVCGVALTSRGLAQEAPPALLALQGIPPTE